MKNLLLGMCLIMAINSNASAPGSVLPFRKVSSAFEILQGHRQGSGYALQWRLANNTNVTRYEVESTYEDPFDQYSNWTLSGTVIDAKKGMIKFVDGSVLPGVISYRVKAMYTNGRPTEVSEIFIATIE